MNECVCCWQNQFRNHSWRVYSCSVSHIMESDNGTSASMIIFESPSEIASLRHALMSVCFYLYEKWLALEGLHKCLLLQCSPGACGRLASRLVSCASGFSFYHPSFVLCSVSTSNYSNYKKNCLKLEHNDWICSPWLAKPFRKSEAMQTQEAKGGLSVLYSVINKKNKQKRNRLTSSAFFWGDINRALASTCILCNGTNAEFWFSCVHVNTPSDYLLL